MLWDATTGEPLEPSFESCPEVNAVALHPGRPAPRHGPPVIGSGTVRVWDIDTGQPVWEQAGTSDRGQ